MQHLYCWLAWVLLWIPAWAAAEDWIRVRVVRDADAVVLAGRALTVGTRAIPSGEIQARASAGRVEVADWSSPEPVRVRAEGTVSVDGRSFPGEILLLPQPRARMDVVNRVPLESYVARAVASELYADWPHEVIKAQAVVVRTYALHERARLAEQPFDLESTVLSQRYTTDPVPASVRAATVDTRGEVLVHRGRPILAVFHSSSGGRTASAEEVWSLALPYLKGVSSPDDAAPDYFWSYEISMADLVSVLREAGFEIRDPPGDVEIVKRTRSGRVERLRIAGAVLSGHELRQILGGRAIRSAMFEVRAERELVRFMGSGSGHGVGLSQWGALELARRGKDYREILTHYYPDTELRQLARGAAGSARWSRHP